MQEASTADEGITCVDEVDAIITDVDMPGILDGVDHAWGAYKEHPRAPLFVVSGSVESKCRDSPPHARFFAKPVDPHIILAQLRVALAVPKGSDPGHAIC